VETAKQKEEKREKQEEPEEQEGRPQDSHCG
jgi:hypothetical protein